MYRLLVVVSMLCVASFAFANAQTEDHYTGTHPHAWGAWAVDGREGGEDIGTAVVIPGIPFSDTGATCDNLDNYDEVCPYTGSTSPDVVYAFTPAADNILDIDLCGSLYDTKVYVYENAAGNVVGCNDDFYFDEVCGVYVSRIEMQNVTAGNTYYIVVDGYGGDCGNYTLEVRGAEICDLVCPAGGVDEGEPDLVDYYVDAHNGGCNSTPYVFQVLEATAEPDCVTLCGESGWYWAGNSFRDTDWFEVTAIGSSISVEVDAEYAVNFFVLNTDCQNIDLLYQLSGVGPCAPQSLVFPTAPGDVYWLWVGPNVFSGPDSPFEFDYLLNVCGIFGTVPAETSTWGGVKDLYR
jgi:hypothetical protein